jgi:hypothetical protein
MKVITIESCRECPVDFECPFSVRQETTPDDCPLDDMPTTIWDIPRTEIENITYRTETDPKTGHTIHIPVIPELKAEDFS